MSGPPVVNQNQSGAIGRFAIGVSAIGNPTPGPTQTGFNVWATIISQYANSPVITQLIQNMDSYIDQSANIDAFFADIFDIDSAVGYGLDVWGRILGVSRVLTIVTGTTSFGFEEALPDVNTFNNATFFTGNTITSNFSLSDSAFRILLLAKALANITDGTIGSLNQILINLFTGRGNAYVTDELNMTMTYTFSFQLTPVEQAIVRNSGVLPKPVGVALTIVQL